jgi:hemerythrin-like domain-containing protein
MKAYFNENHGSIDAGDIKRRAFFKRGIIIGTLSGVAGLSLVSGCQNKSEEEVTPTEDLMREHGLLNRIMLIYDACRGHLINKEDFPLEVLNNSAQIIKRFIEEYHEKLEENFLFPRFEKANLLTDLVKILRLQHEAGRKLTGQIIELSRMENMGNEADAKKMIKLLNDFNAMYRPHEAREDTILFPALKKVVSKTEYFELGEDFENKEHELFGKDGFETMVGKVADIEKQLGIDDLAKFTPII